MIKGKGGEGKGLEHILRMNIREKDGKRGK